MTSIAHGRGAGTDHADLARRRIREVDDAAFREGAAVVDADVDRRAVVEIGDARARAERQRRMRGGETVLIVDLAAAGRRGRGIPGRTTTRRRFAGAPASGGRRRGRSPPSLRRARSRRARPRVGRRAPPLRHPHRAHHLIRDPCGAIYATAAPRRQVRVGTGARRLLAASRRGNTRVTRPTRDGAAAALGPRPSERDSARRRRQRTGKGNRMSGHSKWSTIKHKKARQGRQARQDLHQAHQGDHGRRAHGRR